MFSCSLLKMQSIWIVIYFILTTEITFKFTDRNTLIDKIIKMLLLINQTYIKSFLCLAHACKQMNIKMYTIILHVSILG